MGPRIGLLGAILGLSLLGCSGGDDTVNVEATIAEAHAQVPKGLPQGPPSGESHELPRGWKK